MSTYSQRVVRKYILLFIGAMLGMVGVLIANRSPDTVLTFPDERWKHISVVEAGIDLEKWTDWMSRQNPRGSKAFGQRKPHDPWGTVLSRGGYIVKVWGNPDLPYQSASVGKAFSKLVLQLTIDAGLIHSDKEFVKRYWTGEDELSHPHKYLNRGAHRTLTFRHLWQHKGGFPVTNGSKWISGEGVPDWADWSGDPNYDNYAHVTPGSKKTYSSGGYWRLNQALTAIWNTDLKRVLDEKLFNKIGISPEDWTWLPGKQVHSDVEFYPEMPHYGAFVDPPYSINGHPVVGGGGWVVMGASDLARVGLLIATGGIWRDERLLSDSALLAGHKGGNDSALVVEAGDDMLVWAQVATSGIAFPKDIIAGPIAKRTK